MNFQKPRRSLKGKSICGKNDSFSLKSSQENENYDNRRNVALLADRSNEARYPREWAAPEKRLRKSSVVEQESEFLNLPEAVRVKILTYLTFAERILTQLVCRQVRNDIRLRVGLLTKVDDSSKAGLTFMRDVIVESLIVGRYDNPYFTPLKMLFQPEKVMHLTFDHPMLIAYFDAFLSRCQNIKFLTIYSQITDGAPQPSISRNIYGGFEWRFPEAMQKIPVKLEELVNLVVSFPGYGASSSVSRILAIIHAPNLSRLQIKLSGVIDTEDTTSIHFSVIKFLKRSKKVKTLIVSTDQKKDCMKWRNYQYLGIPRIDINTLANSLQFEELVLTEPSVIFHTWCPILYSQQNLNVFQIFHAMMWPFLRDVIYFSCKTLKTVGIHVILCEEKEKSMMMDLTAFGHCASLKELYICVAGPCDVGHADLINFDGLPNSLETLSLKNASFKTTEVLNFRNLKNLKSLGLVSFFNFKGYGITTAAFKKLVFIRSLDELLVSGFCVSTKTSKELAQLLKITDSRMKQKHSTCYFHDEVITPRYFINSNGFIIFTIFPNSLD